MADLILLIHFLYLLGVIIPVPLIILGRFLGWGYIRNKWFRRIHLAMVLAVVVQVPFQILCPLTVLEQRFREMGGEAGPGKSFVSHWVSRLLYFDFPSWVFSVLYLAFGMIVIVLYIRIPPSR